METVAIVLIAGFSKRFKADKCKQITLLDKKPVFSYSINAFAKSKEVTKLVVVVNKEIQKQIENYVKKNKINATIVLGGKTRQESVENGLNSLSLNKDDIVIIHDGARPLIDQKTIKSIKESANKIGAATTYINEVNTVAKMDKNGLVKEFINRSQIARIQTPQAFKYGVLVKAHQKAKTNDATDDCTLVKNIGKKVALVPGNEKLHKITTIDDIAYLERLLK